MRPSRAEAALGVRRRSAPSSVVWSLLLVLPLLLVQGWAAGGAAAALASARSSAGLPAFIPTTTVGRPWCRPAFPSDSRQRRAAPTMVQSLNLQGILAVGQVLRSPSLLLPHVAVQHIGLLDFEALKAAGIKGIVFDKDNTLTAPYVDEVHPVVADAFERSKAAFGADRLIILSNSAGTNDDPGFEAASRIEKALGIPVLRHATKKPGAIPEVLEHFERVTGAGPVAYRDLCIVGDRLLTDVMWGNCQGMLTVHTQILTPVGDNKVAAIVRRLENRAGSFVRGRGWAAPPHPLLAGYWAAVDGKSKQRAPRKGDGGGGK